MVLVGYRHGLRASELVDLRWDQVDFKTASLHVRRVKQGTPSAHPILEMNCEPSGGSNASRSPGRRLCSPQSEAHLSRPLGLPE
jgi:integrase